MNRYSSVEEYAEHIRRTTAPMIGRLCHRLGPEHAVTVAVCDLLTEAVNIVQAKKMREEQSAPGAYDLAALRVDHTAPSNSETPFEDED